MKTNQRSIAIAAVLFIPLLMGSCVNTRKTGEVYVFKDQPVMRVKTVSADPVDQWFEMIDTTNNGKAILKLEDDIIELSFTDTKPRSSKQTNPKELKAPKEGYYVPGTATKTDATFRYLEINPVFQAVSIPYKYRAKTDTVPYQVATSVNVGLAFGRKFTLHHYRPYYATVGDKDKLTNHRLSSLSFTPALFAGPTIVSLNEKNTGVTDALDRNIFGFNGGLMFVVGVNKLNLGAAMGADAGIGYNADKWIYQGKPWFGFVLGLDFVK